MPPFPDRITSRALVLAGDNIDTDVITPIARVMQGGEALVRYAFEPLRFAPDGTPLATDPFADPERKGAQVLVAGENFGCGSSRETAAWAVKGLGFLAVIAPTFGDIFQSNCLKNGLLPIRLGGTALAAVRAAGEALGEVVIDLEAQTVTAGGLSFGFPLGRLSKERLRLGLDDLGLMRSRADRQAAFEVHDARLRPWVRNRRRAAG